MSELIMCDRCKKKYFTDSRSGKGAYCEVRTIYTDGNTNLHLCKECYRDFLVDFMENWGAEEFDNYYGADIPEPFEI